MLDRAIAIKAILSVRPSVTIVIYVQTLQDIENRNTFCTFDRTVFLVNFLLLNFARNPDFRGSPERVR